MKEREREGEGGGERGKGGGKGGCVHEEERGTRMRERKA